MMRKAPFILLIALSILAGSVAAQNPTKWVLESPAKGRSIKAGEEVEVKVKAAVEPGWYLYGLDQPEGGPIATRVTVHESIPFELVGPVGFPPPKTKEDQNFIVDGKPLLTKYYEQAVEFSVKLKAKQETSADAIAVDVRFQLCDDRVCLPPRTKRVSFTGEADVRGGVVVSATPDVTAAEPVANTVGADPVQQTPTDLWPFIWLAITLGALSLLTPCVFPMIPITVSYFTNHASGSRSKAVRLATIYSLGIIATFTLLGMLLAVFVGAAGINLFAANPWVNILIAAIFLFFAFNLFGAYEITIPNGILTKLDNLTRSTEGEGSGIIGALLMGLTFTLTSFTCTSPFVGTILVAASQGDWQMPMLGMLA
ncbi:MAG TPA: cytochrome c biogenesis protein CcdA, partial [Pyrinomonadaceae bacterium]|nr:cytochrome c biogenesis protein CcdA [Pyrinomonadaceae bacterium]